jgi:hypothetical protein
MVKVQARLPEWYHERLRLWAFIKGVTPANLMSTVTQTFIETKQEEIDAMLASIAKSRGITTEELIEQILNE